MRTPLFIYSRNIIKKNINLFKKKNVSIFFALKANYNNKIIKLIYKNKCGFETVSVGEIKLLLKNGVNPKKIIFSGVCKSIEDIKFHFKKNIGYISVESLEEFRRVIKIGYKNIILKLNLNINVDTKKEIKTCIEDSKFGIRKKEIKKIFKIIKKKKIIIRIIGFHLGSQIKKSSYYIKGIKKIKSFCKKYKIKIKTINIGGGFSYNYKRRLLFEKFKKIYSYAKKKKINLFIEPGRSIVSNSCFTITKVEYIKSYKKKFFAIVDLGMNCFIRPMLYKSYHKIKNLKKRKKKYNYDIVGPICESTDIIYKKFKSNIKRGDYIVIFDTGAYCTSMSSVYNIRRKPKEIILKDFSKFPKEFF
ncbi:diaminopimelate decarboxylase [Candidatus Vidania fulgoroideorum]